jgi:RNA polymerase sigma factor (TIGR02999 family)
MGTPGAGEVTRLLQAWSDGDRSALDEVTRLVYDELRRLASAHLRRERRDHTLQPTALVHETYLKLVDQRHFQSLNRAHFLAIAARLMRQVLVNHAEARLAAKRGGGHKVALSEESRIVQPREVDLIALDRALKNLNELHPRQSRIVELRFFGGLTEEEIASVLCVSAVTVKRDWRIARAAIFRQLKPGAPGLQAEL